MEESFEEVFLSFSNQVAYPDIFIQDGIDVVAEVFLLVSLGKTRGLLNVEYFLIDGEWLAWVLLVIALGILEEEHTGEGVLAIVFFADGVHEPLVFLTLL